MIETHTPLETAVFEALGAASTCWFGDGWKSDVFDSARATQIGNDLVAKIRAFQAERPARVDL